MPILLIRFITPAAPTSSTGSSAPDTGEDNKLLRPDTEENVCVSMCGESGSSLKGQTTVFACYSPSIFHLSANNSPFVKVILLWCRNAAYTDQSALVTASPHSEN